MLSRRGLLAGSGILLAALAVLLAGARPGNAAFPGTNGRIAYTCRPDGQELCVVNADGSALGYLTQEDRPCRGACPPAPGKPTYLKPAGPPQLLRATVGPGFTISLRNKARRTVKKLVEGVFSARVRDRSTRHSFHAVGKKFDARTTVRAIVTSRQHWQLAPGKYRFFCDAHPGRMRGRFVVVPALYRP